ncbi:hypothetical protein DRW07_02730 [Alteromonas sediminis]|uniref:Uncharacterized protein n=1 Tax=Alteromonas sediminis TaxID=2259342 RepID=A0A3N5Y390_9ALTE|nr:hypothetical protein [Alteromonas sediminis]RPJ68342.1 hypothetical protein DRW07_02730 [Alteromonas sediminis]
MDNKVFGKHLHTIANRAMPLTGKLTLMRMGKVPCSTEQLTLLEEKCHHLHQAIDIARQELEAAQVFGSDVSLLCVLRIELKPSPEMSIEGLLVDLQTHLNLSEWSSGASVVALHYEGAIVLYVQGDPAKVSTVLAKTLLFSHTRAVERLINETHRQQADTLWEGGHFFDLSSCGKETHLRAYTEELFSREVNPTDVPLLLNRINKELEALEEGPGAPSVSALNNE